MHIAIVPAIFLVLQCSELCLTIRVPVAWDDDANSEVQENSKDKEEFSDESFKPQNVKHTHKPIPTEYFEYTAKKPQFAVEVAQFHGVQSPENHYKSYPVKPYTGVEKPVLGVHHMLDEDKKVYQPYQKFVKKNEKLKNYASPVSSNYEVFHPYKAEEPALQELYKDPVLTKIRNDVYSAKNRLQNYEQQAGEPNINKDEYLESPKQTDNRFNPQKNVPAQYEIHRPQTRPVYYKPLPKFNNRDHILNQKLRHPWNQNFVKVRPVHYRPVKSYLQQLRQQHALKYDDERNEYPQIPQTADNIEEPPDGYDIYEKGKEKFVQLRNNVDESINQAVRENRPTIHQKYELQNENEQEETDDENEFVPIKNYAQVRKTETVKHLPREAAFEDADSYDEIKNAPRLREAVKSTKAQTVYSEEGYEDTAYDHAGEQKHASDHEGHGGFLKQKEISAGKFKTPSVSSNYKDGAGAAYGDKTVHGEKWKNDNKDNQEEVDAEDYSDSEQEHYVEADTYQDDSQPNRNKRNNNNIENSDTHSKTIKNTTNMIDVQHDIGKREVNFVVPQINFNSTFFTKEEIMDNTKLETKTKKDDIKEKYPYYFNNVNSINRHSPLRYAENFKLIPKKSKGGTEFYDSRSILECPDVDDNIDPIPEKIKSDENLNSEVNDEEENDKQENGNTKGEENFETIKKQPRLKGLGDKIDCFKAKYFGENPLDSPFFKEGLISNPEPITLPNLETYKLKKDIEQSSVVSTPVKNIDIPESLSEQSQTNIFVLLDKLRSDQNKLQESLIKTNNELKLSLQDSSNNTLSSNNSKIIESILYADVMDNIKNSIEKPALTKTSEKNEDGLLNPNSRFTQNNLPNNVTFDTYLNKENVTKKPATLRKKRSVPFIYEPYKIIKDSQVQDSKKTTTSSNISPLIKQLQSSRVVERVKKSNEDKETPDRYVKRNVGSLSYRDIGRKDREKSEMSEDPSFVDVNIDKRRGEPRYELKPANHKPDYIPVDGKKSMTVEDYKARTNSNKTVSISKKKNESEGTSSSHPSRGRRNSRQRRPTPTPNFDISKFIPLATEIQNTAASNDVKNSVVITTPKPKLEKKMVPSKDIDSDDNDYEEYDDDEEEEEEEVVTTTTSTTLKPTFRRRIRIATTTAKPNKKKEIELEVPKLRLITRFKDFSLDPTEKSKTHSEQPLTTQKSLIEKQEDNTPKYREKKKKSSLRTLVTDTKKYGSDDDDDDDMRKEEIDAMIGVQQDMEDYLPLYEKETKNNKHNKHHSSKPTKEDDDEYDDDDDDDGDGDGDGDGDDDDVDDDYDEENNDDDDHEDDNDDADDKEELKSEVTTPEPTKRTLIRTTDAPAPTTEVRNAKLDVKPVVTTKKIEIHKELPVNKSSPHVTQFKQDIKEVEIIREIPTVSRKKPVKNLEALELYKDDELAKSINKLSDVEVFKEDLDLENGPKHGGNYRRATMEELKELDAEINAKSDEPKHGGHLKIPKEDTEASQSENKKHIELDEYTPKRLHGGNLRSLTDLQRAGYRGRNSKLVELTTQRTPKALHGGNLKSNHHNRGRSNNRSGKLREFNDDHNTDDNNSHSNTRGTNSYGTSRNERPMHGGNYRSAKLIQADEKDPNIEEGDDIKVKSVSTALNARKNSAVLLNSFAQAVPILTTTPGYILDPSKRMYYYVD